MIHSAYSVREEAESRPPTLYINAEQYHPSGPDSRCVDRLWLLHIMRSDKRILYCIDLLILLAPPYSISFGAVSCLHAKYLLPAPYNLRPGFPTQLGSVRCWSSAASQYLKFSGLSSSLVYDSCPCARRPRAYLFSKRQTICRYIPLLMLMPLASFSFFRL